MRASQGLGYTLFHKPHSNNLTIRIATKNDLKALSELSKNTYLETYPDEPFTDDLLEQMFGLNPLTMELENPNITFYLAFNNHQLCGYTKLELKSDFVVLDKIYFLKSSQNMGFGSQLLNKSFEHALENNKNSLQLQVYCKNNRAIDFYKKHGFIHTETLPYYAVNGMVVPDVIFLMIVNDVKAQLKCEVKTGVNVEFGSKSWLALEGC